MSLYTLIIEIDVPKRMRIVNVNVLEVNSYCSVIHKLIAPLPPCKPVLYTKLKPFATADDTVWCQGI